MTRGPDFSALFAASPYPYLLVAPDYVIIGANRAYCEATGRTADDLLGKHIFDAFPANAADPESTNLEEVRQSIERAISSRQPHTSALLRYAVPIATPQGICYQDKYWSAVHTPVLNACGEVSFVAQNAIDVTQLYASATYVDDSGESGKPMPNGLSLPQLHTALCRVVDLERSQQERLKVADRRKDEFLAMLAHELRNPLAPIRTAADLLSMDGVSQARVHQTSAMISRQVAHLTSLVDDLLDVSRVSRGLVTLQRVELDMKKVVADAVEQLRPVVESKRHHIVVYTSHEPAHVFGDATRLVQVVGNLLNNAAKYTAPGGRISVDLEVRQTEVAITVEDTGIGMSPGLTRDAFDLFTQAERTPDRVQGGLGIGLAVVRMLIDLHGGHVSARSGGLGSGSAFTLCLPRLAIGVSTPTGVQEAENGSGSPLRLLVVDDNEDAAEALAVLLKAHGHAVNVETDPRAGLARATTQPYDACLLDIGMPHMDGYELARRLRQNTNFGQTILVAVTGYGQPSDREKAAAAGFDQHFVKPVAMPELHAFLATVKAPSSASSVSS